MSKTSQSETPKAADLGEHEEREWSSVGELLGCGCSFIIDLDLSSNNGPRPYRVRLGGMGGGAILAAELSWLDACQFAAEQAADDLAANSINPAAIR